MWIIGCNSYVPEHIYFLCKQILTPFLPDIAVGVESTINYYWLYDGCVEADIPFYLGHAAYMKAIARNKQKNDPLDAESIAHLMRSNLFPQAYSYPGEMRAVRDLLRRRHRLVRHRSEAYTHVQLLLRQQGICEFRGRDVKSVSGKQQILKTLSDPDVYYLVNSDMLLIDQLDRLLSEKEKHIKERAYHHNGTDYSLLIAGLSVYKELRPAKTSTAETKRWEIPI
jgi:transposase